MKKKRITYGVNGMMEYQTVVKVGKKNVGILFSGGSVSSMGVNPATYTTDNIILQHSIENSSDYKRGRITIHNTIELDEELHIESPLPPPTVAEKVETPAPAEEAPAAAPTEEDNVATEVQIADETPAPAEAGETITQMEFSCNDDAKDYLEEAFGFVRSKLRNREDIKAAAQSKGIEIIFTAN